MSEEENIEQPPDSPKSAENENISEENVEPQTTNHKLQTENMEVHKHPHHVTHKKKWTEYLLEFLMLFLAVFLGFVAENVREHRVEREKERHTIVSLVRCLASDTVQLNKKISTNEQSIIHLDNFCKLKNVDISNEVAKKQFLTESFQGMANDAFFKMNDGALQQLKSSGMFHLVHKQNIIDSILKYDLLNKSAIDQEADYYYIFKEASTSLTQVVNLSFVRDTTSFKYIYNKNGIELQFKAIDGIKINLSKEKLNNLLSIAAVLAGTEEIYLRNLKNLLQYNKILISFLREEYHLENE